MIYRRGVVISPASGWNAAWVMAMAIRIDSTCKESRVYNYRGGFVIYDGKIVEQRSSNDKDGELKYKLHTENKGKRLEQEDGGKHEKEIASSLTIPEMRISLQAKVTLTFSQQMHHTLIV